MSITTAVLVTFTIAFFLNLLITPMILFFSHKFKWYDRLDHRKIHSGDIPRLGGIGIFLSFFLASIIPLSIVFRLFSPENLSSTLLHYLPVFGGIIVIHIAGLIDDFTSMRAVYKFLVQVAAALIVVAGGFRITEIGLPPLGLNIPLGIFSIPATVLWIVSLSNAINLVDGMDGLAGGISAIASLFLGIISLALLQVGGAILSFALLGSLLAFLFFNYPPARIFMGDSGALFLGFVLAVVPLLEGNGNTNTLELIPLITLLLIPIFDTAAAIIRRIKNRKPILAPDREHLHHKLLDLKLRTRTILLLVYCTSVVLGVTALIWAVNRDYSSTLFLLTTWTLGVAGFLVLDRLNRSRKRAEAGESSPPTHTRTREVQDIS